MPDPQYITLTDPYELARPRHLAYMEWGEATNPNIVVCVHGLSRNARDFDFLARDLSKNHRVICVDMAGRGKSDWLVRKSDYTYALYISDCLTLLDALKLPSVKWIGTSMGGIIGMMLAAAHKNRISALVLNDVGSIVSAAGLRRILGYVGVGSTFDNEAMAKAYLRSALAPFNIKDEAHWEHMFHVSLVGLADGRYTVAYDPGINQPFRDAVSNSQGISDVDLRPVWAEVECPVLLLRGEHSDILTSKTSESMCEGGKKVKMAEIKDTGHAPALLEESQIAIIRDWIALAA